MALAYCTALADGGQPTVRLEWPPRDRPCEGAAMNSALRIFGVVCLAIVVAVPSATAQSATLKGDLLNSWLAVKDTMLKLADAMPEDKFAYKPTAPEQTFGERLLHVADGNR